MKPPVLEARGLGRDYRVRVDGIGQVALKALADVSFRLATASTLAVVGESGSGKSTLARQLAHVENPTTGELLLNGENVTDAEGDAVRAIHRQVRMVFQDPFGSLNPRRRVHQILEEPLINYERLDRAQRAERVREVMEHVGLRPEFARRYPHMFSGGQRQRIAVARALILRPAVIVADEPVSALDVSIQAQILNLLEKLQEEFSLAYVFITHDLGVVEHIADDVLVLYLGRVMEQGAAARVLKTPAHPYTRALLASTPRVDPAQRRQRVPLSGELPSPLDPPPGCVFHRRCPQATQVCREVVPPLEQFDGRLTACHHPGTGKTSGAGPTSKP
ncbi:MAG: dipeptide ABC transporter ATP-binding protein [Gammaproteobacteria bacterium]|nr:dipeptide ABC transporter ATP-binding protein [Gammaproteobacteria bacterium]